MGLETARFNLESIPPVPRSSTMQASRRPIPVFRGGLEPVWWLQEADAARLCPWQNAVHQSLLPAKPGSV